MRTHATFITWLLVVTTLLALLPFTACKHEPLLTDDDDEDTTTNPIDTNVNPIDTTTYPIDTTNHDSTTLVITDPCDPDSVYFEQDLLPIFLSSCAFGGCHSANDHKDGVILINYSTVMSTGKVKPYDLNDSELYEVITENDEDDLMPPPPYAPLSTEQINLIAKWIMQGAKNLTCGDSTTISVCNTTNVTYSGIVRPILQNNCLGCHSGTSPSGNIALNTYSQVLATVNDGSFNGSITQATGFTAMPLGLPALSACKIQQIQAWITAGAPNN